MLYEITNPSDPYTLVADSFPIAAVATLILGEGKYGLDPSDNTPENTMPIFIFGGAMQWLKERGIEDLPSYINQHHLKIADALDSVLIGKASSRRTFEKVFSVIKNEQDRENARQVYLEERRSSMNNIGARAWALAKAFRERKVPQSTETQPPASQGH